MTLLFLLINYTYRAGHVGQNIISVSYKDHVITIQDFTKEGFRDILMGVILNVPRAVPAKRDGTRFLIASRFSALIIRIFIRCSTIK